MSINVQLRRLAALQDKCGGNPNKKKEEDNVDTSKMSPYEQQQYKIALDMKRTRDAMAELESLPSSTAVDKRARLNNQIRSNVSRMVTDAKDLRQLATKENRKEEYLQLVSHVNKTERLSKGRNPNQSEEESGYSPSAGRGVTNLSDVEMGGMSGGGGPSVRDDPEFQQFFDQTKKNDEKMEQQLDRIGAGVQRLKQNAMLIKDELSIQKALLDETEQKVDNIHGKLKGLNKKLKDTLKKVDQDRWCIYLFCCLLLLGIAGACYYIFVLRK